MALAVPLRSTTGAVRDVMGCSVGSCVSPACSVNLSSAPGAVFGFCQAKCRAQFDLVGRPYASLSLASVGVRAEPVGLLHPLKASVRNRHHSSVRRRGSRITSASVEEGVKETSGSGDAAPKVDGPSPATSTSTPKSPFKSGGKISSIAAKPSTVDSRPPGPAEEAISSRKPSLSLSASKEARPAGQLSPKAADQLKVSKPVSVFNQGAAGAKPASPFAQPGATKPASPFTTEAAVGATQKPASPLAQPGAVKPASPFVQPGARGKRVLDAFKDGEKEGKTTKFGQPVVPTNIFQDVRRTPEEQAADAFKFSVNPGQIFLISSFLLIIGLMLGTAFVVWKFGGIHYNEY